MINTTAWGVIICTVLGSLCFMAGTLVVMFCIGPEETVYQRAAVLHAQAAAFFSLAILSYLLAGGSR